MADTTPTPTTTPDDVARDLVLSIIGSDIEAPDAFNGDWHDALKNTADRWAANPDQPHSPDAWASLATAA